MQLDDAAIRPYLHADIASVWGIEELRPDAQRVQSSADQLPKASVILQPGVSEPTGGAAASNQAILPHTYHITGTFPYPATGTVNEAAVAQWNALVYVLCLNYPHYYDWRFREEMGWDWDDNAEEQTYSVVVIFTLDFVSRIRSVAPP
jgi:hypothetical protein